MAKHKPASALPQPEMLYERNRRDSFASHSSGEPSDVDSSETASVPRSAMIGRPAQEAVDER